MTKKHFKFIAVALLLCICIVTFVACNSYKWDSIGGGEPNAPTISNGGYVIQQGNYVYFINGYDGEGTEKNEWGTPLKQSIMRAELKADGNVNNETSKVVVPKIIYNKSTNGGFAIYGEWIYYATPNNEKNKGGTASTTHTDFMRTKIDGSITQKIQTINSRETEYIFYPTRILYFKDNKINYIDFSAMKTDKEIDNAKGATTGVLAENVSSYVWKYNQNYQGKASICDYIFYTQTLSGDNSYENYNLTFAVKYDGSNKKTIIDNKSYLTDKQKENYVDYPSKVFKVSLKAVEFENNKAVLYYSKSNTINSKDSDVGLYCNVFDSKNGIGALLGESIIEKNLSTKVPTEIYPLGYENGCIGLNSEFYLYNGNAEPKQVVAANNKILKVENDYIYYCPSSTPSALYKININEEGNSPNAEVVFEEKFKIDWLTPDFVGNNFYFFASDDYNYLHYVNIVEFNPQEEDAKSMFIGKFTDADQKTKDELKEEE